MRTVITFGTFDLFHIGHLNILERARNLGDKLVVGISTDACNRSKNKHSIIPYEDRVKVIQALSCVDEVFGEESLSLKQDYIDKYGADILVMGDDWSGKFNDLDIDKVIYLPRTKDISSTIIKQYILKKENL